MSPELFRTSTAPARNESRKTVPRHHSIWQNPSDKCHTRARISSNLGGKPPEIPPDHNWRRGGNDNDPEKALVINSCVKLLTALSVIAVASEIHRNPTGFKHLEVSSVPMFLAAYYIIINTIFKAFGNDPHIKFE